MVFKKGMIGYSYWKGKKHSEETKSKIRLSKLGKKNPEHSKTLKKLFKEGKLKIWNKGLKLNPLSNDHKKKISLANKGGNSSSFKKGGVSWKKGIKGIYKHSEETKKKSSLALKELYKNGFNPKLGKKQSQEWIDKHKIIAKQLWQNQEYREKVIRSSLKGLFETRPTSFEKIIINLINKHNLPYKYVGDGSFLIGYKNPDFINCNGEKTCIEVYYNYFKIRDFGSCKNYEKQRSEHFAKYGWKTIFVNEDELKDENIILNKIWDGDSY